MIAIPSATPSTLKHFFPICEFYLFAYCLFILLSLDIAQMQLTLGSSQHENIYTKSYNNNNNQMAELVMSYTQKGYHDSRSLMFFGMPLGSQRKPRGLLIMRIVSGLIRFYLYLLFQNMFHKAAWNKNKRQSHKTKVALKIFTKINTIKYC